MLACEATTLERMMRPCSITAAPVSSQELSIARIRMMGAFLAPGRWLRAVSGILAVSAIFTVRAVRLVVLGSQSLLQRLGEQEEALTVAVGHNIFRPHDDRVLVVVAVIAAADARLMEAVLAVEVLRDRIGDARLQRHLARADVIGDVNQRGEQQLA